MRRGRFSWATAVAAIVALTLAGCTSGGDPVRSSSALPTGGNTAASITSTPASASASTSTAGSAPAADNPALDKCDDLGILPCARQVNRVSLPIAGSSIGLVYASDRQPGRTADPGPSAAGLGLGGWSLSNLPSFDPTTKKEALPDGTVRTVTGVAQAGVLAVADPTGRTVTKFDSRGRAMQTVDATTGLPISTFGWTDAGLAKVTDASGTSVTITRADDGSPTGIAVSGSSAMTLASTDGQLTGIGYPDGGSVQLAADQHGLLNSLTDRTGLQTTFGYDSQGRLTTRTDPAGIVTAYERTASATSTSVITTQAGNAVATDTVTISGGTTTFAHRNAAAATTTVAEQDNERIITDTGQTVTITATPDPQWGKDVLLPAKITTGAGTGTSTTMVGRTATGGPTTITVDGQKWEYAYDPATRTTTATDPTGATRTTTVDAQGRVTSTLIGGGVPVGYTYDASGRVVTITIGTGSDARTWRYTYRPGSISVTNPVGGTTVETIGQTGVVTGLSGPGGTGFTETIDTAGRITGFTAPGAGAYAVTWGANGLPAAVNSPTGPGGPQFTGYTYDGTGALIGRATADGAVSYQRTSTGQVSTIDAGGNSAIALTYDAAGHLTTGASPGATLSQTYSNGQLTGSATTIGALKTRISRTTDGLGHTTGLSIDDGAPITYAYNGAGQLVTAGKMSITRDAKTGWITGRKLGALTEKITYNQFGEPTETTVTGATGTIAAISEQRDALGRITSRTTTTGPAGSTKKSTTYAYDTAGRLIGEVADGAATSYSYDPAGNVTAVTNPAGTTKNTYDSRNALQSSGSTNYGYDGSGRLSTATGSSGTTKYTYEAQGDLATVSKPAKPPVNYVIDALGRRVAVKSGDTLSQGIVYLDDLRPAATVTPTGAVDETYVYDGDVQSTAINNGGGLLPAYLTKSGTDYLELPDASGGPALVIDAASGTIADAVDRTAYGSLRSESAPDFQLIGYGGGIADPDTTLVHFGARDYDTTTGRWTSPDPLGIAGGSANLYQFVSSDPVNRTDPRGTCDYGSAGISFGAGLGPIAGSGGFGVAWAGGQIGIYSTVGAGGGLVGDLSVGVGGSCQDSTNGDTSLGNFGGTGRSGDIAVGPFSGGSDTGYDSNNKQSSSGYHGAVNIGGGLGGSAQGTLTSILCLFGCPPPPTTVCGALGCDSSPGKSSSDPSSSNSGLLSPPSKGARSTGDPHLKTADGARYDMQAVGEFTWATTDSQNVVIQTRQQPMLDYRTISMVTAIAVKIDGDQLEITPPPSPGGSVVVTIPGSSEPPIGTYQLPHGATVVRSPLVTVVTAKDGSRLWIRDNPYGLDIVATFADADQGKVHGLAGPFTGSPTTKVQTAGGQTLDVSDLHDYNTLYRTFADSWRVGQGVSLFTDHPGDATAFNDPTFPDKNPPAPAASAAAAAKAACTAAGVTGDDLAACVFDVSATGNAAFATSSSASAGAIPTATPGQSTTGAVTGDLQPGATVSGNLGASTTKEYTFTVPAGTVGYFAADPACQKTSTLTWAIDNVTTGAGLDVGTMCNDLGRIAFPQAGTYRVRISGGGAGGSYRFQWLASRPDLTQPLTADVKETGTIDKPGARDIWTMTVSAGTVAYLAADPSCDKTKSSGMVWDVTDTAGTSLVGASVICSDIGRVVFPNAGTYRVVVTGQQKTTGPYTVEWESSRPDAVKVMTPDQTVTGTIDKPGARDIWTVTVTAGAVGYFAADPACDKSQPQKLTWDVTDDAGSSLVGASYICSDIGRVVFTKAGSYRVVVSSSDGGIGGYAVQWKSSRPDGQHELVSGQTARGTIDKPGARDAWGFAVTAGAVVTFKANPSCDKSAAAQLTWEIVNGAGDPILGSSYICDDLGAVTFPTAGTYQVLVASENGATSAYSFTSSQ